MAETLILIQRGVKIVFVSNGADAINDLDQRDEACFLLAFEEEEAKKLFWPCGNREFWLGIKKEWSRI